MSKRLQYGLALAAGCSLALLSAWFILHVDNSKWFNNTPQLTEQTAEFSQADHLIKPYISLSYNPIEAMKNLYLLWGYQVSNEKANCQSAIRAQLHCYRLQPDSIQLNDDKSDLDIDHLGHKDPTSSKDLAFKQLILINRPAILTMQDNQRTTYFAILYRIGQNWSQLLLAGQRLQVPTRWLKAHWQGEFRLLWHSQITTRPLKLYSQGNDVIKLNQLLTQVLGDSQSTSDIFDQKVKDKVEAFQMWQGIKVDGIAGNKTLMLLDSYTNHQAPTLVSTEQGAE